MNERIRIKPTNDLFIASLWTNPKNESILLSLLNAVLTDAGQPQIVKATVLNAAEIQKFHADKQIRFDVRVEDENGTVYDVEVQRAWHPAFLERILIYWAKTYAGQMKTGDKYDILRPVKSIIITEFPLFDELKKLHTIFELRSQENPDVVLTNHLQIHFLRLGNFLRDGADLSELVPELQGWMNFWAFGAEWEETKMNALLENIPAVRRAYEELQRFSTDPSKRVEAELLENYLFDMNLISTAWVNHGRAKGLEEGLAEGERKKAVETALLMKAKKKFTVKDIMDLTGLSPEEIEKL